MDFFGKTKPIKPKISEEFKQECEDIYVQSIMLLAEEGGIHPTFFLLKDNEKPALIAGIDFFKMPREELVRFLSDMIKKFQSDAIIFVSQAYESQNVKFINSPKDDPERREVLNLMFYNTKGEMKYAITGEVKQSIGSTQYVDEWEWVDTKNFKTFMNLENA